MNATTTEPSRQSTYTSALLLGIGVDCALLAYAVLRYPASLSQGGHLSLLVISGALLALGVTMACAHPILVALRRRNRTPA